MTSETHKVVRPATSLPWYIDVEGSAGGAPIIVGRSSWRFERDGVTGRNRAVAKVLYEWGSEDPEVNQNARYIVHACNMYEEMYKVLKTIDNFWKRGKCFPASLSPYALLSEETDEEIVRAVYKIVKKMEELQK